MGRSPCCEKEGLRRGAWSPEEDELLTDYIALHGHPNWRALPKHAGLRRCGKSCRLRWINYLRPDIKRGNFTADEEDSIIRLHQSLGNRWSAIAAQLPGRTDNEIKNVWHTTLKKRRVEDDHKAIAADGGGGRQKPRKKSKAKSATVDPGVKQEPCTASPGRSSSGVTCSTVTVTESVAAAASSPADNAAITTASHGHELVKEVSSAMVVDDSFWSSTDLTEVMDLGALDSLTTSSSLTISEDMDFWLKILNGAGDIRDLAIL